MRPLHLTGSVCVVVSVLSAGVSRVAGQPDCQRAKLTADDGAPDDWFGYAVDICRDTAIIGAHHHDHLGNNYGAAYMFERSGTEWTQVAEIAPEGQGGFVGWSVAIEGNLVVVGAKSAWTHVFQRTEGGWVQVAQLRPSNHTPGSLFGYAVALSGNSALVSAPEDNDLGARSGSVHVFERDANGAWPQAAKLLAGDGNGGDEFGHAVALSTDVAVVGAWGDSDPGTWAGSAYVFERDPNGLWCQTAKLLPSDGRPFSWFGSSVSVSADAIVVGAPDADGLEPSAGAAYVFERDPNGAWVEVDKLMASDGISWDSFGRAVAMHDTVAIVGAPAHDGAGYYAGAVYVFTRDPNGVWLEVGKLTAADAGANDLFGAAVAVSGNTGVIGAYKDDDNGTDSGSAYIFAVGPDNNGNGVMDVCECIGDLDHDYDVDLADLAQLLSNYGMTQGAVYEDGDLDDDGDVDLADLAALLAVYGTQCW